MMASVAKILVVDDEPDMRFLLRFAFEKAGHEVAEAGDGIAALRSVKASRPALVVTDMMMPVMDGAELIKRLRAEPGTADIPILCVSGHTHLAVDADASIDKQGDWGDLISVAEGLMAERHGRN
jgi:CheY-like chemotaxis protein